MKRPQPEVMEAAETAGVKVEEEKVVGRAAVAKEVAAKGGVQAAAREEEEKEVVRAEVVRAEGTVAAARAGVMLPCVKRPQPALLKLMLTSLTFWASLEIFAVQHRRWVMARRRQSGGRRLSSGQTMICCSA